MWQPCKTDNQPGLKTVVTVVFRLFFVHQTLHWIQNTMPGVFEGTLKMVKITKADDNSLHK